MCIPFLFFLFFSENEIRWNDFSMAGVWKKYGDDMEYGVDVSFLFLRGERAYPAPPHLIRISPHPRQRLQFFPITPENFAKLKFCAYFFIEYAQIQRLFFMHFMIFCLEL